MTSYPFTERDVGCYFLRDGKVYQVAWYCRHPTVGLKLANTDEVVASGAVGSSLMVGFAPMLIQADEIGDEHIQATDTPRPQQATAR